MPQVMQEQQPQQVGAQQPAILVLFHQNNAVYANNQTSTPEGYVTYPDLPHIYGGGLRNGLPAGYGIQKNSLSGNTYEGGWKDGRAHGYGIFYWANGDRYEYLVSAIDVYGTESGLSPAASSAPFGVQQARPPVQVFARSVKEGVSLQWEQADMTGVQGFAVYRRAVADKKAKKIAVLTQGVSQYTDKQTAAGVLYVYSIATLTAAGETVPSDERAVRK